MRRNRRNCVASGHRTHASHDPVQQGVSHGRERLSNRTDPVSFLQRSALVFPDKTAVVHGDRQYTYREFVERVNRLASGLRASGLEKHDRVAFLCPKTPALLEAHFAVPAASGVLLREREWKGREKCIN